MNFTNPPDASGRDRMKEYIGRVAAGPRMSKDLTENQAEDALSLILDAAVSPVQAAAFLIAQRMKRETVAETVGFWRALDKTTVRHTLSFERLLQVADPFDGFNRIPYFGAFVFPVLAQSGLPAYGHSSLPLPPKCGITFEQILVDHYAIAEDQTLEKQLQLLQKFHFGFLSTRHTHPKLEALRSFREEIVKRPILATLEKMLLPVMVASGGHFLATGYFHKGYEIPMLAVAKESGFDVTVLGNGMEGTTLFAVHKDAHVHRDAAGKNPDEMKLTLRSMYPEKIAATVAGAQQDLKKETLSLGLLSQLGESALKENRGPAAPLIAHQAGSLLHLFGRTESFAAGFEAAASVLQNGSAYAEWMRFLDASR